MKGKIEITSALDPEFLEKPLVFILLADVIAPVEVEEQIADRTGGREERLRDQHETFVFEHAPNLGQSLPRRFVIHVMDHPRKKYTIKAPVLEFEFPRVHVKNPAGVVSTPGDFDVAGINIDPNVSIPAHIDDFRSAHAGGAANFQDIHARIVELVLKLLADGLVIVEIFLLKVEQERNGQHAIDKPDRGLLQRARLSHGGIEARRHVRDKTRDEIPRARHV